MATRHQRNALAAPQITRTPRAQTRAARVKSDARASLLSSSLSRVTCALVAVLLAAQTFSPHALLPSAGLCCYPKPSDDVSPLTTPGAERDIRSHEMIRRRGPLPSDGRVNLIISADKNVIRRAEPFNVTLRIENLTSEPLDLTEHPSIILEGAKQPPEERSRFGLNFSGDLPITSNLPPGVRKKSTLFPGEGIEIRADIEKLEWQQRFLSAYSPGLFGQVVPDGEYVLRVEFLIDDKEKGRGFVKIIKSNELSVSVEGT